MKLSGQQFFEVVKNTPLVAIDLLVKNTEGRILLGFRTNDPARDFWFVPGGRIRKEESLDVAFQRIVHEELGIGYNREQARFFGVSENIYDTNFLNIPGVGTHYINLVYEMTLPEMPGSLPASQHQQYRWFTRAEALQEPQVHPYVIPYFADMT